MKKYSFIIFFIAVTIYHVCGQAPKVGFLTFSLRQHTDAVTRNPIFTNAIYDNVSTAIVNLNRFSIIPTEEMSVLDKQVDVEKGEEHIRSELTARGKRMGAEMVIYTMVGTIMYDKSETKDSKTGEITISYAAKIAYTVRCVDMETGGIKYTKVFNGKTPNVFYKPLKLFSTNNRTPEGAIMAAIEDTKEDVSKWIRKVTPLEFRVIKFTENVGKYEMIVKGGNNVGLNKDVKNLYVKSKEVIEGETLYTALFTVKIEDVQESFTRCSIELRDAQLFMPIWNDEKKKKNICALETK